MDIDQSLYDEVKSCANIISGDEYKKLSSAPSLRLSVMQFLRLLALMDLQQSLMMEVVLLILQKMVGLA